MTPTTQGVGVAAWSALAGLLIASEALAGSCVSGRGRPGVDSAGYWDSTAAAHTTLQNDSKSLTIEAEIDRADVAKSQKTIGPGEKISHLANFGSSGKEEFVHFTVSAKTNGKTLTCAFKIKWDVDYLFWELPDDADTVCGDPTIFCPDCEITCSKTFHKGKARWNTTFTISD